MFETNKKTTATIKFVETFNNIFDDIGIGLNFDKFGLLTLSDHRAKIHSRTAFECVIHLLCQHST